LLVEELARLIQHVLLRRILRVTPSVYLALS